MSTYICSDVHGRYIQLRKTLSMVNFTDNDYLIINGDLTDRGNESAKCIEFVLDKDNVELLIGNHEVMYMESFEESPSYLLGNGIFNTGCDKSILLDYNGGNKTVASITDYRKTYGRDLVKEFYDYLKTCKYIKTIGDLTISHTGIESAEILNNLKDFVWQRDFFKKYFVDREPYLKESQIIGHTSMGRNYIMFEPGETVFYYLRENEDNFVINLDGSDRYGFIPLYKVEDKTLHLNKGNRHFVLHVDTMDIVEE